MKLSYRFATVLLLVLFTGCQMEWAETPAIPEAHITEHGSLVCIQTEEERKLIEEQTKLFQAQAELKAELATPPKGTEP